MTDPKRLLDDAGTLTREQRRVLAADARFLAPGGARSQLWASLAAVLGTGAVGPSLSSAGTAGAGVGAATQAAGGASAGHVLSLGAVVKLTLVGLGIGASIATANHYLSSREADETQPAAGAAHRAVTRASAAVHALAVPTTSLTHPVEPAPSRALEHPGASTLANPAAPAPELPAVASSSSDDTRTANAPGARGRALTSPEPKQNQIAENAREESQLVGSARSLLRAGNPAGALQLLVRATSRFPNGVLIQEREALRIEALRALGRTSEARALADAFVEAYPKSPHLSRVTARE